MGSISFRVSRSSAGARPARLVSRRTSLSSWRQPSLRKRASVRVSNECVFKYSSRKRLELSEVHSPSHDQVPELPPAQFMTPPLSERSRAALRALLE